MATPLRAVTPSSLNSERKNVLLKKLTPLKSTPGTVARHTKRMQRIEALSRAVTPKPQTTTKGGRPPTPNTAANSAANWQLSLRRSSPSPYYRKTINKAVKALVRPAKQAPGSAASHRTNKRHSTPLPPSGRKPLSSVSAKSANSRRFSLGPRHLKPRVRRSMFNKDDAAATPSSVFTPVMFDDTPAIRVERDDCQPLEPTPPLSSELRQWLLTPPFLADENIGLVAPTPPLVEATPEPISHQPAVPSTPTPTFTPTVEEAKEEEGEEEQGQEKKEEEGEGEGEGEGDEAAAAAAAEPTVNTVTPSVAGTSPVVVAMPSTPSPALPLSSETPTTHSFGGIAFVLVLFACGLLTTGLQAFAGIEPLSQTEPPSGSLPIWYDPSPTPLRNAAISTTTTITANTPSNHNNNNTNTVGSLPFRTATRVSTRRQDAVLPLVTPLLRVLPAVAQHPWFDHAQYRVFLPAGFAVVDDAPVLPAAVQEDVVQTTEEATEVVHQQPTAASSSSSSSSRQVAFPTVTILTAVTAVAAIAGIAIGVAKMSGSAIETAASVPLAAEDTMTTTTTTTTTMTTGWPQPMPEAIAGPAASPDAEPLMMTPTPSPSPSSLNASPSPAPPSTRRVRFQPSPVQSLPTTTTATTTPAPAPTSLPAAQSGSYVAMHITQNASERVIATPVRRSRRLRKMAPPSANRRVSLLLEADDVLIRR